MVVVEKILLTQELELHTVFSGAVGKGTETRSYQQNRKSAFKRMAESERFKTWHRIETARRLGQPTIEEIVDKQMKDIKVEYL